MKIKNSKDIIGMHGHRFDNTFATETKIVTVMKNLICVILGNVMLVTIDIIIASCS